MKQLRKLIRGVIQAVDEEIFNAKDSTDYFNGECKLNI